MTESTASTEWVETVVKNGINRCVKVTKGARNFSYSALVVVGNKRGTVGCGFGKAREVPIAVEKGIKKARKDLHNISLVQDTIPHMVIGKYEASTVLLKPASPGTGVVAGSSVRAVVEAAGIKDILTKSLGSNRPLNLVKATMEALKQLRTREQVEQLRGVSLE